jgi:hypothetical protein
VAPRRIELSDQRDCRREDLIKVSVALSNRGSTPRERAYSNRFRSIQLDDDTGKPRVLFTLTTVMRLGWLGCADWPESRVRRKARRTR